MLKVCACVVHSAAATAHARMPNATPRRSRWINIHKRNWFTGTMIRNRKTTTNKLKAQIDTESLRKHFG